MGVDSRRGDGRSRAPSTGKAKPQWRRDSWSRKTKYGVDAEGLTQDAAVVEAAPPPTEAVARAAVEVGRESTRRWLTHGTARR